MRKAIKLLHVHENEVHFYQMGDNHISCKVKPQAHDNHLSGKIIQASFITTIHACNQE